MPATATIYGHVTDETGAPVAQAAIQAYSDPAPECKSSQTDFGVVLSAEKGGFQMDLPQGQAQDSVCVFTFASPPQALQTLANSDTMLVVLDFRVGLPQDSVGIDFTLHSK